MNEEIRIPFCEELSELRGKTILDYHSDDTYPEILLVFTDRTAVILKEDTSCCYYRGECGPMDTEEPGHIDRAIALEIWNKHNGGRCLAGTAPRTVD